MTQVKSISIKDESIFDRLQQVTPNNMGFSQQVSHAVKYYVDECEKSDDINQERLPSFDAPIDDWKEYMNNHPEHVGNIMRRIAQLTNILKRENYAVQ